MHFTSVQVWYAMRDLLNDDHWIYVPVRLHPGIQLKRIFVSYGNKSWDVY